MPRTELRHSYPIAATPSAVADHLADPANYVGLSPLVVEVRDVTRQAGLTRYTAAERFRFLGFLRHDNPIAVTLSVTDSDSVHGEVVSPGGVRMAYQFTLTPEGGGTRVTDILRMTAPLGLLHFAASRARAVQLGRARELRRRLAG